MAPGSSFAAPVTKPGPRRRAVRQKKRQRARQECGRSSDVPGGMRE
jgi:hypothetical protein